MKKQWQFNGLGCLLLILFLGSPVIAQNKNKTKTKSKKAPKRISLTYQNTPCKTVIDDMAKQAGIQILIDAKIRTPLTLHLNNVPWPQALKVVAKLAGLKIKRLSHRLFRLKEIPRNALNLKNANIE